jgi:hypothetical protein
MNKLCQANIYLVWKFCDGCWNDTFILEGLNLSILGKLFALHHYSTLFLLKCHVLVLSPLLFSFSYPWALGFPCWKSVIKLILYMRWVISYFQVFWTHCCTFSYNLPFKAQELWFGLLPLLCRWSIRAFEEQIC